MRGKKHMGFSRLYAGKLIILIATIGITVAPSFVFGLGLGAIKLNSSLSEILDAEIDLIAATANDVSDLKVKLASREAFLRAGIDRTGLLNSLRFKVKRHNSGKYYIKITSRKPIREPFLNFLLEINWKNGRMLREYTMLIDPPGRRVQQAQQSTIQAPQTAAPVEEAPAEPAQPVVEESPFKDSAPVEAKTTPEPQVVDDAGDKELFPRRPVDEVEAPKDTAKETEKAAEPEPAIVAETMPEAEPVIPETVPEPEPEPVIVDDSEADHSESGQVLPEFADSGKPLDEVAAKEPATETFGEGELFPTIPLTEYDESKSIEYDEEPVEPVAEATSEEDTAQVEEEPLMGGSESMENGNLDYGITKKSDNLWTIASKMKGDDATVYQVMMALLKSNPNAFVDGNVNRLKVGQVLRIDDPGLITAISKEQAVQDYIAQTEAWEAYRQQVAASAEQQPLSTGQVEPEPADNIASAPSGELTLSAPEGEDLSTANAPSQDAASNQDVVRLRDELQRITQQAQAERGKNSALNERLRELEAELETMQRSLSVRNDELAALQQQATKTNEAPAEAAPEPAPEPAPVQESTPPAPQLEEPVVEQPAVEEAPEEPVVEQPVMDEQPEIANAPVDTITEAQPPAPAMPDAGTEQPAAEAPAGPSTSLVDTIIKTVMGILKPVLGSSLLLFIGAPVLAIVLILIVIMALRKRSTAKNNFEESILSGAAPVDDEPAVSISSQSSGETSSFLSDFAISGVGAIQTEDSEVDPLTEADVFMAYGRYEAAEERLQEAIAADPTRNELKVKLLEVYNTNKNQAAFESTAEDLYASLGDKAATDSNWLKVVVMGKQIAPDNPIFSSSPTITSETTESVLGAMEENRSDVSMTDSQVMDIGLETGVFSAEELSPENTGDDPTVVPPAKTETDMGGLDFNLGDDTPVTDQQETQDNIAAPDELDFNLGGDEPATEESTDASMDFNLDLDAVDDESTKSMAIDLNDMELSTESDDDPTASMAFDANALDLDAGDLDATSAQLDTGTLDFNMDSDGDSSMDLNLDAGDAMDMSISSDADEVGTKLDLAKAYIDMGDSSGAKSILDEVLDEGNDEQKQEAQQLVSQLS